MILLILATTSVTVWSTLQLPTMMADIVNRGIVGADQSYIWREGFLMVGVTLVGAVATICSGFFAAKIGTGWTKKLRLATFQKVENFSQQEINQFSTASLITRSTNDIQQIQMTSILILRMVLQAPIMAVGAVLSALAVAPNLSWIMIAGVAALFALVSVLFVLVLPKFRLAQKLVDRLNLVSRENLTGLRIIRAFRNEKYEEKKFDAANRDLTALHLWTNRAMSAMMPLLMLIVNFISLGVIWFGAGEISRGALEIGGMVAFMQYALQVITAFMFLAVLMIFIPRAQVSISRVGEILDVDSSVKFPEKTAASLDHSGVVEFREVTFSYPDSDVPVLTNISFTARPGETTAFIGSTGSGKSTLINLIPRFYDATAGEILLDGVKIKDISRADLVALLGYVPQKGVLFSGTVASNIRYGAPKIAQADVEKFAEIAQADFVKKLDGKFDAHIAQGGANVSGGQKQRLAIARALAKNPEILIFDDSFSALDYETDRNLRAALVPVTREKTTLIVAQRISTIKNAEQIIVLDEGKIAGRGTHYELLKSSEIYREIAKSQLSDDEFSREIAVANNEKSGAKNAKNSSEKSPKVAQKSAPKTAKIAHAKPPMMPRREIWTTEKPAARATKLSEKNAENSQKKGAKNV